jgi:hypothetical protein
MSIQVPERITTEIFPRITETVSKGLGLVALSGNTLPKNDTHHIDLERVTSEIPQGGLAYRSFGELANLYEELAPQDAETELNPIVDKVAKEVSEDFAKWDEELDGPTPSAPLVINRKDAIGAITLWQTHPSEHTEAAAEHILHYAAVATPGARRQSWSEAYFEAFKLMVAAKHAKDADASKDLMSLTTALRQHSERRLGSEVVQKYESNYVENDN